MASWSLPRVRSVRPATAYSLHLLLRPLRKWNCLLLLFSFFLASKISFDSFPFRPQKHQRRHRVTAAVQRFVSPMLWQEETADRDALLIFLWHGHLTHQSLIPAKQATLRRVPFTRP